MNLFTVPQKNQLSIDPLTDPNDQVTEFLTILLGENPPDAIVNICLKNSGKGLQTSSFRSTDKTGIIEAVTRMREEGDLYYEICLQPELPEPGKRGKAVDKSVMLGIWMDIDVVGVGHASDAYPKTKEDALAFVAEATKATLIIFTGGGIHMYLLFEKPWIFKDEDDRKKAEALIKGFQRHFINLGVEKGWKLDSTADLARLLRVPGTFNHKGGGKTPVEIIHHDPHCLYSPADFASLLDQPQEAVSPVAAIPQESAFQDYPLAKIADIDSSCGWVEHCKIDAYSLKESAWFASLSIVGRCENGRVIAHERSEAYPKYTIAETDDKMAKALKTGPRTCKNIRYEQGGEQYCSKCPFWNHIKSPISLGDTNPNVQLKIKAVKLLTDSFDDRGLPFAPENVSTLVSLQKLDAAAYSRVRAGLASLNISVTKLETEMSKFVMMATDLQAESDAPYLVKNNSFFHVRQTRLGEMYDRLTNFTATIVEEIVKDDGAKVEIYYKIKGQHADGTPLPDTEVTAESFKTMGWVGSAYGSRAVIYAGLGTQDQVRAAIQLSSDGAGRRVVYSHTGWRKISDEWRYLTSCGALGASGLLVDIGVELGDRLKFYSLPGLPEGVSAIEAVRTSLKFLDLAPPAVAYGLFVSIYRAPLGEVDPIDFSDFLHGFTGTLKSELAGNAQAHFGAGFRGKNLPASWSSTGNYLEKLTFLAKDVLLTIDDFIPTGSLSEAAAMHAKADRVLRSQGNLSGRGRMAADTTLRNTFFPRGLNLGTGEDIPKGQSLRSRLNLMEIKPGDVDLELLTELQRHAANGVLAGAMSAFIQWLAPRIDGFKETFPEMKIKLRVKASNEVKTHLRTPEIVASKMLGIDTFLKFAVEVQAITESQAADIWQKAWSTFCEADAVQAELQATENPVVRFLDLLRTALVMGLANVEEFAGGSPTKNPEAWGWESVTSNSGGIEISSYRAKGKKIGWINGLHLYLDPDASYLTVQEIASKSGNPLTISPIVLRKRMDERGLIQQKVKGGLIKLMPIQGVKYKILHILTTAVGNVDTPAVAPIVEPAAAVGVAPEVLEMTVGELRDEGEGNVPEAPNFFFDPTSPDDFEEQARKAAIEQAKWDADPWNFDSQPVRAWTHEEFQEKVMNTTGFSIKKVVEK